MRQPSGPDSAFSGGCFLKCIVPFGKTTPTIRAALRHAQEQWGIDAFGKKASQPNRRFWPRDHAQAVAEFFRQPGATMKAAIVHFGKSQSWISKARKIAREQDESGERVAPASE